MTHTAHREETTTATLRTPGGYLSQEVKLEVRVSIQKGPRPIVLWAPGMRARFVDLAEVWRLFCSPMFRVFKLDGPVNEMIEACVLELGHKPGTGYWT